MSVRSTLNASHRDHAARMTRHTRDPRVAHLIETDILGGAERMLVHLAGALGSHGWGNVAFLPGGREGWLTRQLEAAGVTVEHVRFGQPFSPRFARDLAQAFERHEITVAHSHEFAMACYGAWAARRVGIPHLFTMHGGRDYAKRLRRRLALRLAAMLSQRVVAVSDAVAERLASDLWLPRSRITTIVNGIPGEPLTRGTLREELRLAPDARLIVSVGTMFPVKGHRYLVEALARLVARHSTAHVAIAGRSETETEAVRALAAALGVADRMHLLGPRDDVSNVLASADVFALPSLSEGLPLALLEAMFSALPIVASAVGEVPVVLDGGSAGILVPPGDVGALATALERLLADPADARALGQRAARRAAAEYGLERMVTGYTALYQAVQRRSTAG
jgi:glycosyltransferase involved in cell wall biosynthesis